MLTAWLSASPESQEYGQPNFNKKRSRIGSVSRYLSFRGDGLPWPGSNDDLVEFFFEAETHCCERAHRDNGDENDDQRILDQTLSLCFRV